MNGRYVWLWNLQPEKAAEFVSACRIHGYDGLIVKAQDGTGRFNTHALAEYVSHCATAHLRLGVWGFLYGKFPQAEAELAVHLSRTYHADFYVADAETGYESADYPASALFCKEFRALAPHLPAMLSSFGRIDLHSRLNWRAWKAHGFDFAPQAYLNESEELSAALCVRKALSVWPAGRIHPTAGVYHGARGHLPASAVRSDLQGARKLGARGYSLYAGDFMDSADWKELAGL